MTGPLPSETRPFRKYTVPALTGAPPGTATEALSVSDWPRIAGFALALIVVVDVSSTVKLTEFSFSTFPATSMLQ